MAKKKSNDNVAKINLGKVVPSPIPDSDIDLILAGETPVGNLNALNTHGLKYYHDNSGGDAVTPINKGGTGATTVAGARNNLGLGNTSGAVPIADGGTGATTATGARTNLGLQGAETKTLLWTNSSPTSTFAAQTISLSLSSYIGVGILFRSEDTDQHLREYYYEVRDKNRDNAASYSSPSKTDGNINSYDRTVSMSNTTVVFGNGTISYNSGNVYNNKILIPYKIYGIKEVS